MGDSDKIQAVFSVVAVFLVLLALVATKAYQKGVNNTWKQRHSIDHAIVVEECYVCKRGVK